MVRDKQPDWDDDAHSTTSFERTHSPRRGSRGRRSHPKASNQCQTDTRGNVRDRISPRTDSVARPGCCRVGPGECWNRFAGGVAQCFPPAGSETRRRGKRHALRSHGQVRETLWWDHKDELYCEASRNPGQHRSWGGIVERRADRGQDCCQFRRPKTDVFTNRRSRPPRLQFCQEGRGNTEC